MQICHVYQFKDNEISIYVEMMSFCVLYEIRSRFLLFPMWIRIGLTQSEQTWHMIKYLLALAQTVVTFSVMIKRNESCQKNSELHLIFLFLLVYSADVFRKVMNTVFFGFDVLWTNCQLFSDAYFIRRIFHDCFVGKATILLLISFLNGKTMGWSISCSWETYWKYYEHLLVLTIEKKSFHAMYRFTDIYIVRKM